MKWQTLKKSLCSDLQRSSSQRESKLLDVIDQTKSAVEEQVADLRNRCATLEHQLTVAKETASELQLYVRRKVSMCTCMC